MLATLDVLPIGLEGRLVTLCHCLEPRYQKDAEHVSLACDADRQACATNRQPKACLDMASRIWLVDAAAA